MCIISFDGAHDIAQWQRSRALAARTGAHFTYFLSCVFLLSPETRRDLPGARQGGRASRMSASRSRRREVAARLGRIWRRSLRRPRDRQPWLRPFRRQGLERGRLAERIRVLPPHPARRLGDQRHRRRAGGWRDFADNGITGFRAPYLSTGDGLVRGAGGGGLRLRRERRLARPGQPERGGRRRALRAAADPRGPAARRVIAMDYNLFVRHSGGFERPRRGGGLRGTHATRPSGRLRRAICAASACRCSSASTSR